MTQHPHSASAEPSPAIQAIDTESTTRKGRSHVVLVALSALIIGLAGLGWIFFGQTEKAPDVRFTTIKGEQFSTSDLRGKVVLVNFWATSCTTCVQEMPQMVKTYERYNSRGLEFVAVAMSYDPANYVINYAETRQLPFRVALDTDGGAARQFGNVQMTPTTFLIDDEGHIVKRYLGIPDFTELHRLIEQRLPA